MTTSKRIGLALGGGAARGLAHIQALHAFDDLGLKPAHISGTSMGALVGVAYAAGLSAQEIETHARSVLSNRLNAAKLAIGGDKGGLFDLVSLNPISSPLLDGAQLVRLVMPDAVPAELSDLEIPASVCASDFYDTKEVVFTAGSTVEAVSASIAIPGAISAGTNDPLLIDGGCVNPVPISHLQECDVVVGINVTGRPHNRTNLLTPEMVAGAQQVQQQTIAALHREKYRCEIWLEPDVDAFRVHDFFQIEEILSASEPLRDELKRALEDSLQG